MRSFLSFFLVFLFVSLSLASYEDARCKCVCVDRHGSFNGTKPTGKIFVKAIAADQCNCQLMLGPESSLCPYCDCKYQVRNTTTIKVIVCLILVIISALTLYMIFLLLLEPLLSSRRAGYKPTTSSEASLVTFPDPSMRRQTWWFSRGDSKMWSNTSVEQPPTVHSEGQSTVEARTRQRIPFKPLALSGSGSGPGVPSAGGVSTVVKTVRDQQQRWKGNVKAQRARVFSEHTLLN